ncbi:MAG: diguanylate cyclase [Pseudomonadota bacterium]
MSTRVSFAADKLNKIRNAYIKQIPIQLEMIRRVYNAFILDPRGENDPAELHRRIHTLKGSSASFGLSGLSGAADAAEHLAKETMAADRPPDESWQRRMRECLALMEAEAGKISPPQEMEMSPVKSAAFAQISGEKTPKTIYLCDDDPHQRQYLAAQIECFGFKVSAFDALEALRTAVRHCPPDAMVMDQIFPREPMGGSETLKTLRMESGLDIPTVFVSSQNDFLCRLSAVRAGSSAYFVKPVNITELCATLNSLTLADTPEPYRVMIVDDDPHLAQLHASILQDAGMITLTVNDPLEVMAPLLNFKPDLILTDMYMPGCSGMELAKTIRQIGASFSIPIVYLSGETDADTQFHAIRMGGDEFLTKPISPEHLISAVAGRAERMKIIRSLMIRDGMTGLYNHTTIKEYLETMIAHARRQGADVCYAMIDLDYFKRVNDTYGHPVGDQVLVTLARLLRQRLRNSDVVGRYGGEEFALILPDCDIAWAVALLNHLRESFASIRFPVGETSFSATFSAGIAALSSCDDGFSLCKAADEALYRAKNEGRNRVVMAGKS